MVYSSQRPPTGHHSALLAIVIILMLFVFGCGPRETMTTGSDLRDVPGDTVPAGGLPMNPDTIP